MPWQERTKPEITLISPSGIRFVANWREDPRDMEQRLGVRPYAGKDGVFVQQVGTGGVNYPLRFSFSGPEHDEQAQTFFQTCSEKGTWEINHPTVIGKKNLYLVSVKEDVSRTSSANVSNFETTWLESIAPEEIVSVPDFYEEILSFSITNIDETAGQQFFNITDQSSANLRQSTVNSSSSMLSIVTDVLSDISALNAQIQARINAIQRGIRAALNQVVLQPLQLAAQFQELIRLPVLATNGIQARLDAYQELTAEILGLSPAVPSTEGRNVAGVMEMGITAAMTAAAQSSASGTLNTRREAIETSEFLANLFNDATDGLDAVEELFKDQGAERQYFTQSDTYSLTAGLIARSVDFLIKSSFSLSVEKRIVLTSARSPFEIAVNEYGGENDENYDLFVDSNMLEGDEILLLPPGREVVVYV